MAITVHNIKELHNNFNKNKKLLNVSVNESFSAWYDDSALKMVMVFMIYLSFSGK